MKTIGDLLTHAHRALTTSDSAPLDALILLEWATEIDRTRLLAERKTDFVQLTSNTAVERYLQAVKRRSTGTPVAYITGEKEFFGLPFYVGPGVLIPRPDSEVIVETIVDLLRPRHRDGEAIYIYDCCAGTGCIGISATVALLGERSAADDADRFAPVRLLMSDIDEIAVQYARRNAFRILEPKMKSGSSLRWTTGIGDLLECCRSNTVGSLFSDGRHLSPTVICANPPYLTARETDDVLRRGWGEPTRAFDGGKDGLEIVRRLIMEAFGILDSGMYLIVEHGSTQSAAVVDAAQRVGFVDVVAGQDLAGRDRFVCATKPSH